MTVHRYAYGIYSILASLAAVVAAFALAVVRYGASVTWQSLNTICVSAYRVVGSLKPEYRESYETHGLSLCSEPMRG